jgi:hypothetical protein
VQRQLKLDPVDPTKLSLLEQSDDDALPLIATLFRTRAREAADDLLTRIESTRDRLGEIDSAAAYACARIEAAVNGEELTVSDLQLISGLASDKAASATHDLRQSRRIKIAVEAVEGVTGVSPRAPVLVMAAETGHIGFGGEERGSYRSDAGVITIAPSASSHTLRHELVHATQPEPLESGPGLCRREMIEGTTDGLALAAGSEPDELSYAPQLAAISAFAEVLARSHSEWLRELNATATPEITIGDAVSTTGNQACMVFAEAQFAAEGHDLDLEERIERATFVVRTRLADEQAGG